MVANPREPTEEEVEQHNLTRANFKAWCPHCNRGLAMRDKHSRKKRTGRKYQHRANGEISVPEAEVSTDRVVKFSIDYTRLENDDDLKLP